MKILIADDDLMYLQMLDTLLTEMGFETIKANNGNEAWQLMQVPDAPKFCVLDWMMPHLNGIELTKKIRSSPEHSSAYIIMLTAKDKTEDIVTALEAGADDHMNKPFDLRELQARINAGARIRSLETDLIVHANQLQLLNKNKDRFFSIIAHDLRSPFQSILNLPELILEDYDSLTSDEIKKAFHDISHDARKVFTLLNNLLEWARVQTGGLTVCLEKFFLEETVSEIVDLLKANADNKKIKLVSEIQEGISVNADKNMLHTILRNLVSNAIKFTRADDSITISAKNSNGLIEISVIDTGVGIDGNTLKKLFKLEEKVTSEGTAKESGTGLGLLLCKELVEKMNGKIWVESQVGVGSAFRFTLPL